MDDITKLIIMKLYELDLHINSSVSGSENLKNQPIYTHLTPVEKNTVFSTIQDAKSNFRMTEKAKDLLSQPHIRPTKSWWSKSGGGARSKKRKGKKGRKTQKGCGCK